MDQHTENFEFIAKHSVGRIGSDTPARFLPEIPHPNHFRAEDMNYGVDKKAYCPAMPNFFSEHDQLVSQEHTTRGWTNIHQGKQTVFPSFDEKTPTNMTNYNGIQKSDSDGRYGIDCLRQREREFSTILLTQDDKNQTNDENKMFLGSIPGVGYPYFQVYMQDDSRQFITREEERCDLLNMENYSKAEKRRKHTICGGSGTDLRTSHPEGNLHKASSHHERQDEEQKKILILQEIKNITNAKYMKGVVRALLHQILLINHEQITLFTHPLKNLKFTPLK